MHNTLTRTAFFMAAVFMMTNTPAMAFPSAGHSAGHAQQHHDYHKMYLTCRHELKTLEHEHEQLEEDAFNEADGFLGLITMKSLKAQIKHVKLKDLERLLPAYERTLELFRDAADHGDASEREHNMFTNGHIQRLDYIIKYIKRKMGEAGDTEKPQHTADHHGKAHHAAGTPHSAGTHAASHTMHTRKPSHAAAA